MPLLTHSLVEIVYEMKSNFCRQTLVPAGLPSLMDLFMRSSVFFPSVCGFVHGLSSKHIRLNKPHIDYQLKWSESRNRRLRREDDRDR